jgi:hypothetical protein
VAALVPEIDEAPPSRATLPLLMDATTPTPRPGIPAAFAGVATVREAVVAIDADFCILMDASASMSVRDVAGLDELQASAAHVGGLLHP